ncbi:MAG: DUF4815 domain-containing protein [Desulfobulbaceae bacterium]|jgi:hypothetical protein|nr:DUF4815 domain-containing protein [Desulfobulbaceae bacterium]
MRNLNIQNYYNRFDPSKNHELLLARDGYRIQGAETNDMQEMFLSRLKGVADALLADGDIIQGGQVIIDTATGDTQAQESVIYLSGATRRVPAAIFTIPLQGQVSIGVYLAEEIISDLEDPTLRNPAIGTRGQGEPGAWRLRVSGQWGVAGDGTPGEYYPVHTVDDGVLRAKDPPPNLDSFNQAVARYDRDHTSGGIYITAGMVVRAAEVSGGGVQIYTVSEGRARVFGYAIDLPTSRRLSYAAEPDLRYIETEIHTADGSASQRLDVAHAPIRSISMLRATLQKTVNIVHGGYAGAADALPDAAIVDIIECKQGTTVYGKNTDYKKTGDTVDWNVPGKSKEPAPGSTYSITYTYMATVQPVGQDFDGFSVVGAVAASSIIISYYQAVPRIDRLCLMQDGSFVWLRGVAGEINARPPAAPPGVLAIASVRQSWRDAVEINNDGIRVVTFDTLTAMSDSIAALYNEVARQRLEADISTREAGARAGIFVDPLSNDEMRDQGIAQSAAIVKGWLTLAVAPTIFALDAPLALPAMPGYTPIIVLAQTLRTGDMQVNPYMSFGILPARVTLTPAIDQWTEIQSNWTSDITQQFDVWIYAPETWGTPLYGQVFTSTSSATQLVSSTSSKLQYLRQISVAFRLEGFGPGEVLQKVLFDGVNANFTASPANASGVVTGSFVIPPNIPAGAKTVTFRGPEGGSEGSAAFVGQGQLTVQVLRTVNTVTYSHIDPLAQTFSLDDTMQVCGVDLWFTAKQGEVRVQIREVQNGFPTRVILAEAVIQPGNIIVNGDATRLLFPAPVQLLAGIEYAIVVLCNDAITALAIAEMGKFDATAQKWVASQPYTVGVLLSSSNASTWTVHQDKDMAFRLLAADFVAGTTQVEMGEVTVSAATDLLVLAVDETPSSATHVEYELTLPDGAVLTVAESQPARLAAPISGKVKVKAKLTGTNQAAPLLWPGAQLLAGKLTPTGDYYSRSIPATDANKVILIYEAFIPSGAAVTPQIQFDGGNWQSLTLAAAVPQGNGIVEYRFERAVAGSDLTKIRITLSGTASARPFVGLIRFMAIK